MVAKINKVIMKVCRGCSVEKNVSEFYLNKTGFYHPYCKPCNSIRSRDWKRENKQKHYLNKIKDKLKITHEQYETLFKRHNGKCAICFKEEKSRRLSVDHCHKSGAIRGLLCRTCNIALGYLNDDIQLFKNAILYLSEGTK